LLHYIDTITISQFPFSSYLFEFLKNTKDKRKSTNPTEFAPAASFTFGCWFGAVVSPLPWMSLPVLLSPFSMHWLLRKHLP